MNYISPPRVARLPSSDLPVKHYAVATLIFGAACELEDSYDFFKRSFSDSDCPPNVNGHFRVLWFFVLMTRMYKESSTGGDASCELVMEPLQANGCSGMIGVRLWILFFKSIDEGLMSGVIDKVLTNEPPMLKGPSAQYIKNGFFKLFKSDKKRKGRGKGKGGKQRRTQSQGDEDEDEDEETDTEPPADKSGEAAGVGGQSLLYRYLNYIGNPYTDNHYGYSLLNNGHLGRCNMLMDIFSRRWAFRQKFEEDVCAEQMNEMNYFSPTGDGELSMDSLLFRKTYDNFCIPKEALQITNFSPYSPTHWRLWGIMKTTLPERRVRIVDDAMQFEYSMRFLKDPLQPRPNASPAAPPGGRLQATLFYTAEEQQCTTAEMARRNERVRLLATELSYRLGKSPNEMTNAEWLQAHNDVLKMREQVRQFKLRKEEEGQDSAEYMKYIKKYCSRHFFEMIRDSRNIPAPLAEQVKWYNQKYPDTEKVNKLIKERSVRLSVPTLSYFDEFIISMTNLLWHRINGLYKNIKETWMAWLASFTSVIWLGPYNTDGQTEGPRGAHAFVGPNQTGKSHFQNFVKSISAQNSVQMTAYNSKMTNSTVKEGPGANDQSCELKIFDEGSRILTYGPNDTAAEDIFKTIMTNPLQSFWTAYVKDGKRLNFETKMRSAYGMAMNLNKLPPGIVSNPAIASRLWTVQMSKKKREEDSHSATPEVKQGVLELLQLLSHYTTIALHMMNAGVFNDMDKSMFDRTIEFFNASNKSKVVEERRVEMLLASAIALTALYSVWMSTIAKQDGIKSMEEAFYEVQQMGYIPREITIFLLSLYSNELYFTNAPEEFRRIFTWPPPMKNMRCVYKNSRDGSTMDHGSDQLGSKPVNKLCIQFSNDKEMYKALAAAVNRHEQASGEYNAEMVESFIQMQSNTMISETGFTMVSSSDGVTVISVCVAEKDSVLYISSDDWKVIEKRTDGKVFYFQISLLVGVEERYRNMVKRKLWVPTQERVTVAMPTEKDKPTGFEFSTTEQELKLTEEDVTELPGYVPYTTKFARPILNGAKYCPYKPDKVTFRGIDDPIPTETKCGTTVMQYVYDKKKPDTLSLIIVPGELREHPGYGYSDAVSMFQSRSARGTGCELVVSLSWLKSNHVEGTFEDLLKKTFSTSATEDDTRMLSGKYIAGSFSIFDVIELNKNPDNVEKRVEKSFYNTDEKRYEVNCASKTVVFTKDPTESVLQRKFTPEAHELLNSTKKRRLGREYERLKKKLQHYTEVDNQRKIQQYTDELKLKREEIREQEAKFGLMAPIETENTSYPGVLTNNH